MSSNIRMQIGNTSLRVEFFDTQCARQVIENLPIEAVPDEWGDEFYFEIPVINPLDKTATRMVKTGEKFGEFIIIESGIKPNEKVISDGILKVKPGIPVKGDDVSSGLDSLLKIGKE
ncbi:MAG: hypothetical protein HGB33_08575 [Syntrophaceae bacterium]|nr:hypothetical protein [Syntrophaceae bacterium]